MFCLQILCEIIHSFDVRSDSSNLKVFRRTTWWEGTWINDSTWMCLVLPKMMPCCARSRRRFGTSGRRRGMEWFNNGCILDRGAQLWGCTWGQSFSYCLPSRDQNVCHPHLQCWHRKSLFPGVCHQVQEEGQDADKDNRGCLVLQVRAEEIWEKNFRVCSAKIFVELQQLYLWPINIPLVKVLIFCYFIYTIK